MEEALEAYVRWQTGYELVKQRLAYWIFTSRCPQPVDPYRDWMLAERLLHSRRVLGVLLVYMGQICPGVGGNDCVDALAGAIAATVKDWAGILGDGGWSASECAHKILSDRDLVCAMGLQLTRIASEYCPSCCLAAWAVSWYEDLNLGVKENWLLAETCANILRGFKLSRGSTMSNDRSMSAKLERIQDALKGALEKMNVPAEKRQSYVRVLAENEESPFVRGINAMADL